MHWAFRIAQQPKTCDRIPDSHNFYGGSNLMKDKMTKNRGEPDALKELNAVQSSNGVPNRLPDDVSDGYPLTCEGGRLVEAEYEAKLPDGTRQLSAAKKRILKGIFDTEHDQCLIEHFNDLYEISIARYGAVHGRARWWWCLFRSYPGEEATPLKRLFEVLKYALLLAYVIAKAFFVGDDE
jgi:hypothetical protein